MRVLFSGRVPKDPGYPEDNEDAFALDPGAGRIAVSDGASESFDSRTWAELLAHRFVHHPVLSQGWLSAAIAEYAGRFDRAGLSWSKQSAFDRGSFATLLGLRHSVKRRTLEVVGVGDSLCVLLDGHELVDCFPYVRAEQFHHRPDLFSTDEHLNGFFVSPGLASGYRKIWSLRESLAPAVLCMTDGIAEWALRRSEEGRPVWADLAGIATTSELEGLVFRERLTRAMRVDDSTLVVASLG